MHNFQFPSFFWGFLFFFFLHTTSYAQCAGTDNTVTVCNKDQDISNRNYTLFDKLLGSPVLGGTWSTTNPVNFAALNASTGEVDLWRINNAGVHLFTYTNNACGESAIVTLNLGGYSGEDNIDGSANACSDNSAVNLHGFLGSEIDGKVQDFNGQWEEVPAGATGFLDNTIFNAFLAGPGVYTFTYTLSAIGICSSEQSTVILEVHPSPFEGTPSDLVVCSTDDLSGYTNFNLNSILAGEDANGTWSENGTNQLNGLSDNIIDVQQINANFGYGTYTFTYTVYPTHPICTEGYAEVNIVIMPALEGTLTAPSNYCLGASYDIVLNYDASLLPNGIYQLEYQINDSNGTKTGLVETELNNGQGTITVEPSLIVPNEFMTIDIIAATGMDPVRDICLDIDDVMETTLLISNASAATTDRCLDTDVPVNLDNIIDISANPFNGLHSLNYSLTFPDNTTTPSFTVSDIEFTNGVGSFSIPYVNLGTDGAYKVDIEIPDSIDLDCLSSSFNLIPYPEDIKLDLIVDNNCDATKIDVVIDAPQLSSGNYMITYEVVDQNTNDKLIENMIVFIGGQANYLIDITPLPESDYSVTLHSLQNDTTLCRTVFEFNLQENFAIGGMPETPQAANNQTFCTNDYGANDPTLADLMVTASGTISFFDTETDSNTLPLSTILINGENYFVSVTDSTNSCESPDRVQINVLLTTPGIVSTTNVNPVFCATENATVLNLMITAPNNGTILWYDSLSNGNPISESDILIDGKSYYAVEQISGSCESDVRIEIVPSIINPLLPNLSTTSLSICGLDNPTVSNLSELQNSMDVEIQWFNMPTGGFPLSSIDVLENGTYYAESNDTNYSCINPERVAVTVNLTNCDPEDYGFFIPDGFSPNNDGRNDTFFIPNIEIIFPDFTLEILNRYGASVFKGNMNNPSWDGTHGNGIAPNGVYFYIINYNKEGMVPKQGRLYLNK